MNLFELSLLQIEGILLIGILLVFILKRKTTQYVSDLQHKAVLITGCDSGFGSMTAERLDKLGLTVYAGCLFPEGKGAQELKSKCSSKLHILNLDVTKDEHANDAAKYIQKTLGENQLWAVINNAGTSTLGHIEWTSVEAIQKVFDVNTWGPVRVTKAAIPLLRKSKGRVIFISSLAGYHSNPGNAPYCMSKHATVSLANALRGELAQWGISVHNIRPTLYRTNISNCDFLKNILEANWKTASEEVRSAYGEKYYEDFKNKTITEWLKFALPSSRVYEVIDVMIDAVIGKSPKKHYTPGLFGKISHFLMSYSPVLLLDYCLVSYLPKLEVQ